MFLKEFIQDDATIRENKSYQNHQTFEEQNLGMHNHNQFLIRNQAFTKNLGNNTAKYDDYEVDFTSFEYENFVKNENIINQSSKKNSASSSIYDMNIEPDFIDFEQLEGSSEQGQNEQIIEITETSDKEQQQQREEYTNQQEQLSNSQQPLNNFEILEVKELTDYLPTVPFQSYSEPINLLQLPEYLKQFLLTPLQQPGMFQCIIQRNTSGLNAFTPKYKLFWEKNKQFLLSAKKAFKNHKYKISQDPDFSTFFEPTLLGRVELSKQSKGDYYLFDNGQKGKDNKQASVLNNQKKQLGGVFYEAQKTKIKQPRKMTVLIKLNGSENNIFTFESRKPVLKQQFNQMIHALDFYGRAKFASVKNTQLVCKTEKNDLIYFLVGKIDDQNFHLDFMNPFSPLIAFQIALTIFDYQQH